MTCFHVLYTYSRIRLACLRTLLQVSRGFAFVEFHNMGVCRHVMQTCGGGDDARSAGHLTIDGSQA